MASRPLEQQKIIRQALGAGDRGRVRTVLAPGMARQASLHGRAIIEEPFLTQAFARSEVPLCIAGAGETVGRQCPRTLAAGVVAGQTGRLGIGLRVALVPADTELADCAIVVGSTVPESEV